MLDIKYIREIMGDERSHIDFSDCRYYPLKNGNCAKVSGGNEICNETRHITCRIINTKNGEVDAHCFPFKSYFPAVKLSNGYVCYQHIDTNGWHNNNSEKDYEPIRRAVFRYMDLFS